MTNKIPKNIHLFWAGDTLPDYAGNNIFSFIKNNQDNWRINLWLTHPTCLFKTKLFKNLETLPNCLVIRNIYSLLESTIFNDLNQQFLQQQNENIFLKIKSFIEKELIGLGNPAATKDVCVPLILYSQGGYYFDLDTMAGKKLTAPNEAKYGVLVVNNGMPNCLATEKAHPFCAIALLSLIEHCKSLPQFLKSQHKYIRVDNSYEHFSQRFFNLQILRNRQESFRNVLTCLTSGTILSDAFKKFANTLGLDATNADYIKETNFRKTSPSTLEMGVTLNSAPLKKIAANSNTKDVTTAKAYPSFITIFKSIFIFATRKNLIVTNEDDDKEKVIPWRENKKFNSFELEDIDFRKKISC